MRADLAVLQRMVFGRSSERAQPEPSADGGDAGQGRDLRGCRTGGKKPALPVSWTDVALIITNRKFYEFRPGRKEA